MLTVYEVARRSRTTSASECAMRSAVRWSAASTITRTMGSVPDGRSSTRPVLPSSASASAHRGGDDLVRVESVVVDVAHVDEDLRVDRHDRGELGEGLSGARHLGHQVQAGEQAVAGGGEVGHDHVSGLLAAQRQRRGRSSPRAHSGRRPGLDHLDAVLAHGDRAGRGCSSPWRRACRPAVRRARPCASARMAMIWSPSMTLPAASTARQRSASPSCAMPTSAPCSGPPLRGCRDGWSRRRR